MPTFADRQYQESGMLEPRARRLDSHEELIEGYPADLTFSDDPPLAGLVRAMRRALLSKEVRLPSILCLEVACVFGLDPTDVLPAAAAIEFVHTFTSIHADLPALSGYERRRGKPAWHEEFAEATAILAGDGFLGTSLALITTEQKGTPRQLVGVVRELARLAGVGGMIGGQALEVTYAGRAVDRKTLGVIQDHGTGSLFEASGLIGAILAGATSGERETIAGYARLLGLCFRIVDDLRSSATQAIETPEAGTSRRRTATFETVYGLSGARLLANESLEGALRTLEGMDKDTQGLAQLAFGVRRGEYVAHTRTRAWRGMQTEGDGSQGKSGEHQMGRLTTALFSRRRRRTCATGAPSKRRGPRIPTAR